MPSIQLCKISNLLIQNHHICVKYLPKVCLHIGVAKFQSHKLGQPSYAQYHPFKNYLKIYLNIHK